MEIIGSRKLEIQIKRESNRIFSVIMWGDINVKTIRPRDEPISVGKRNFWKGFLQMCESDRITNVTK